MFKQPPKVWSAVREYGIITVATLIMVIGIYVFKFPNNFSFGGVSGMAVLLAKLTSLCSSNLQSGGLPEEGEGNGNNSSSTGGVGK